MNATAPNDNQDSPEGEQNQQPNPVQPGRYVVSGQPGTTPEPQPNTPSTPSETQNPQAAAPDLQSEIQSTVAAATGTNLAGESPPSPKSNPASSNTPPTAGEAPDPSPFKPPTTPPMDATNPSPPTEGNKMEHTPPEGGSGKFKTIILVVAGFILVALISGVAWFFILSNNSDEPATTVNENINRNIEPIFPPSPSPITGTGFGDLPEATTESEELLDPDDQELTEPN